MLASHLTSGSFLDRIPEADVFVLRMVLHDWNDSQAALILKNIRYCLMSPMTDSFDC
jgi:hypothetical protein